MKRMLQQLRRAAILALGVVATFGACAKDDYTRLYQTQPVAPSLSADDVKALKHLGPTLIDKGVNFGVYSEHATKVQLALFDDPESDRPTRQMDMVRQGDVWNLYVEGVGVNQAYGYIAWGPNWEYDPRFFCGSIYGFKADVDADGNRFDPNKLLWDPYAKAIHRDHDWGKGSVATGPQRTQCTYGAASKSLVTKSTYAWSDGEAQWRKMRQDGTQVGHRWQDLVIYEVHPKGFTMDAASGVRHPGTYRGIGEKADYLKELGINAVELMPVFEKPLDGGYWGYQTLGFFIPEREYSFDKERNRPTEEFKWMVDQLHQRGIEVILDVVYNHTGEGGLWREKIQYDDFNPASLPGNFDPDQVAGLYSFRGLDNQAYYALDPANKAHYWNNTGVGNETRCNHTPMRHLIVDSLRYWAEEMHVDGFRFDLAPILTEKDLDPNSQDASVNTVAQDIIDDPVLQQYNTRVVAEPWSLSAFKIYPINTSNGIDPGYHFPSSTTKDGTGWGEWNGPFRDWWRSFVNYDDWLLNKDNNGIDFGGSMLGSRPYFQANNRRPYSAINFITVHDGFTMYDLVTYSDKVNGCGPLNPVCCANPNSGFCDRVSGESNNRNRDWRYCAKPGSTPDTPTYCQLDTALADCGTDPANGQGYPCTDDEPQRRQAMRALFSGMLLANGTPLILGGDEWMRTQLGNNNAYSSGADNAFNWFQWGYWESDLNRVRMHDFVAKLVAFRNAHRYALAPDQYGPAPLWMREDGQQMGDADWGRKHIAVYYRDVQGGPALYMLFNMSTGWINFNLPGDHQWNVVVDTQKYYDEDAYFAETPERDPRVSNNINIDAPAPAPGTTYNVPPRTVVVLEAAQ